ncbi:hypothetical protein JCM8547_006258 [Rhodosporidiobolus lusitaniae]
MAKMRNVIGEFVEFLRTTYQIKEVTVQIAAQVSDSQKTAINIISRARNIKVDVQKFYEVELTCCQQSQLDCWKKRSIPRFKAVLSPNVR